MEAVFFGVTGVVAVVVALVVGAALLGAAAGLALAAVKLGVWIYYGFIQHPEVQRGGEYRLEQGRDPTARAPGDDGRPDGAGP